MMKPVYFVEAFVARCGILLAGFVTLPLAAYFAGATITATQTARMSVFLFVIGFCWHVVVRWFFDQWWPVLRARFFGGKS